MSGNTYPERKKFSNKKINELVKKYMNNDNKLKSLFDESRTMKTVRL